MHELDALTGEEVAELLDLEPLPVEGGLFRQTLHDGAQSAIYFLLIAPACSALHVLPGPELWHRYAGAAVELLLLHPDGTAEHPVLGVDLRAGERPQVLVPGGTWQGARSLGAWSLVGTTMTPAYDPASVRFASAAELVVRWPSEARRIRALAPP